MVMDIVSIADDANSNSSKYIGSVLVEKMAVGAS
jgi:PmbA protein